MLNVGGGLDLIIVTNTVFLCSSCTMRISGKPRCHSRLTYTRLILPTPILSRWKNGDASCASVGDIHVPRLEPFGKVFNVRLVSEALESRIPGVFGRPPISLPDFLLVPVCFHPETGI
jgi:hypothetical protein